MILFRSFASPCELCAFELPVVFPVHPRIRKMIERFELDGIRAIEPLGFLEFLQLEAGADGLRRGAGRRHASWEYPAMDLLSQRRKRPG